MYNIILYNVISQYNDKKIREFNVIKFHENTVLTTRYHKPEFFNYIFRSYYRMDKKHQTLLKQHS